MHYSATRSASRGAKTPSRAYRHHCHYDEIPPVDRCRGHPQSLFALYVDEAAFRYVGAFRDADPAASLDSQRRGSVIARDSGNGYVTLAIRTFRNSGNTAGLRGSVSILATVIDRLGRYEPATMAGFAVIPAPQWLMNLAP